MHGRGADGWPATRGLQGEPFEHMALQKRVSARPFRRRMHTSIFR